MKTLKFISLAVCASFFTALVLKYNPRMEWQFFVLIVVGIAGTMFYTFASISDENW